ncbi:MAG: hypothetical protein KAS19_01505 [Anaerolineales bacterium]|nr:hypothetical protein [Anaerolineales bacterium]
MTTGTASFDPVGSALLWCALIWAVAAWAGWALQRRKQPLYALVPAGTLLALTLETAGAKPDPLLWLLGTTLPALALVAQDVRRIVDSFVQATYTPHTLGDFNKLALLRSWRRLRWRLWLAWIRTRFDQLIFKGVIRRASSDPVGEQHHRAG